MTTTVELVSSADSLTFYPTPDVNGWVYDNATLDAWYALPDVDAQVEQRANAHGSYDLGQVFTKEAVPIIAGQFFGASATAALLARRRLSAFFMDGMPVTIRVTDELGVQTRAAQLVDFDAPFRYGFDHFKLDMVFIAPDPRRYGPALTVGPVALPSASSGLTYPITYPRSYGSAGSSGQVSFTNTGLGTTYPRILVGGAGAFVTGFVVTEIETGRELRYLRDTTFGEIVELDSRTQRATLNGGDVTGALASRQWFSVPAGTLRRYQINALGSVTGAPTLTLTASPAEL